MQIEYKEGYTVVRLDNENINQYDIFMEHLNKINFDENNVITMNTSELVMIEHLNDECSEELSELLEDVEELIDLTECNYMEELFFECEDEY